MCNRFNLKFEKLSDKKFQWVQLFRENTLFDNFIESNNYQILPEYKPTDPIFHILQRKSSVIPSFSTWGVKPDWSNKPITNSRSEKLFSSPFWRTFISKNRCLIPVSSFFEWQEISGKKFKKKITFKNESTCLAGLYGDWKDVGIQKDGYWVTILTQDGNSLMKKIHNSGENQGRQPVVMRREYWEKWLSPLVANEKEIGSMIEQFSEEEITVEGSDKDNQPSLFG